MWTMTDEELKGLFEAIRQEIAAMRQETRQETAGTRQEIAAMRQETRQEIAATRQETAVIWQEIGSMRQENEAAHAETRRHFDVALEGNRHEIRLIAEKVLRLEEKMETKFTEQDDKFMLAIAETRALIKFSQAGPDRPAKRRTTRR
jgi:uncharacterized protein (DUF3084 family)